ncbi:MAG: hypothetical protein U0992_05605 [Planctomycetaceae bacterium]
MVHGRLIDPQGQPLAGRTIEAGRPKRKYVPPDIVSLGTDETGIFSVGLYADLSALAHDETYTVLNQELVPNVGESIDLGDLVIDPKTGDFNAAKPKHPPIVTKAADAAAATTPASATPVAETQLSQAGGRAPRCRPKVGR